MLVTTGADDSRHSCRAVCRRRLSLATAFGLHLPDGVSWRELTVVALATSIGFTFALFFAAEAIPIGPILVEAKLGALLTAGGSLSAAAAAVVLRVGRFAKPSQESAP
jgi:Na+/H+ antiporter NhaA